MRNAQLSLTAKTLGYLELEHWALIAHSALSFELWALGALA
jgi:hypothetical protein